MRNFVMAAFAAMALTGCGPTTADFVQKVATSDMYEVQAGKIAAEKGQSDAVKQFGQQMVDAHTKTTEELTSIVKAKNLKVDLPSNLDAKHQKLIEDLNSVSAQEFDKTYAKQQVDAHKKATNLFKKYASQGDDADVKQFAQKTLPTIEHHLEEAKKLPSGPPVPEEEWYRERTSSKTERTYTHDPLSTPRTRLHPMAKIETAKRVQERSVESSASAVEWGAIFAGGLAAIGITAILFTLGPGLGLTTVSPWSLRNPSPTTFGTAAAIWMIVTQWLASAFGGYLTGRLRTKWVGIRTDEVLFRDTAHGLLAWALGTVIMAALVTLGSAATAGVVAAAATQCQAPLRPPPKQRNKLAKWRSRFLLQLLFPFSLARSWQRPLEPSAVFIEMRLRGSSER